MPIQRRAKAAISKGSLPSGPGGGGGRWRSQGGVVSGVDRLHAAFADGLARRGACGERRIEAAFRAVPRHRFLPGVSERQASRDRVIVTKIDDGTVVSAATQPSFMAVLLQQLG